MLDRTKEPVKFEGVPVRLQNMIVIMPPINFKAMRRDGALERVKVMQSKFAEAQRGEIDLFACFSDDVIDTIVTLTHMAISRNYPDITKEDIEEGLDANNAATVLTYLITQNPVIQTNQLPNETTLPTTNQ